MNPESILFEQLSILDQAFSNTIDTYTDIYTDIAPLFRQWILQNSGSLRTTLHKHQIQMVVAMMTHVVRMTRGFVWTDQVVKGKLGVIADPPGAGKTLSVLAFLAALRGIREVDQQLDASGGDANVDPDFNPSLRLGDIDTHSNRYFYSNEVIEITDISACNLVVVPQTLLDHWKQEIAKHTTMQPFVVDSRRILRNNTTADRMVQSPFVLATNKTYRYVLEYAEAHQIHWKHMFFDDAAHIFLANTDILPKFEFLWLISGDWMSFLLKNTHFHPSNLQYVRERMELSPACISWIDQMVEQNAIVQTRVESSSFFKSVVPYTHPCRVALLLRNQVVDTLAPVSVSTLTVPCASNFSYSQITPAFLASRPDLTDMIPTLFQSFGLEPMAPQNVCAHYRDREALITRKLQDDCSICLEPTKNRVLLSCCMGSFCGECILRQLASRTEANCPTCRAHLYLPNILYVPGIEGADSADTRPVLLNKPQQAVDYIRRHPTGSFIVHSSFDNTFYQLQPLLQQIGVGCELLSMPLNRFHNSLRAYQEGRIRVLFVNDVSLVHGLNLQRTSHLLFFYGSPFYDTQQTLMNAALRQGRTEPLTVVRLSSVFE
jgi:hypothetical protein